MEKYNLHIYPSPIEYESRILKETKTIIDQNLVDRIFILGIWKEGLLEHEDLGARRQIWRLKLRIGSPDSVGIVKLFRIIEWTIRIILAFRKFNIVLVNCHSLTTLPLGFLCKLFIGSTIVYDTHELETETEGSKGIRRIFVKFLEKMLIKQADVVITVNKSIADWYSNKYKLDNVYYVRNIPYLETNNNDGDEHISLRDKISMPKESLLFIYQGSLSYGRGIEILLAVFAELDFSKHIVFMGMGQLDGLVKEFEKRFSNIHFHPAVPPKEVYFFTRDCDVGISLNENVSLNHYLSLPNKIFEYILSGLPVIASDFPETSAVVQQGGCGWSVPINKEEIFSLISALSKDVVEGKRINALEYRKLLSWHNEEKVLLSALRRALKT